MDYNEDSFQRSISNMEQIMQRYNFGFKESDYPIERILSIQKQLVVAYLNEYIPGIVCDVDVLYDEDSNNTTARIVCGDSVHLILLNNWRITDD